MFLIVFSCSNLPVYEPHVCIWSSLCISIISWYFCSNCCCTVLYYTLIYLISFTIIIVILLSPQSNLCHSSFLAPTPSPTPTSRIIVHRGCCLTHVYWFNEWFAYQQKSSLRGGKQWVVLATLLCTSLPVLSFKVSIFINHSLLVNHLELKR